MKKAHCECQDGKITEAIYSGFCPANEKEFSDLERSNSLYTIKSYTLDNSNVEVVVITWGATIVSIKYPDKYGEVVDVVLGFDNLEDYMNPLVNPLIGCVLGRCADQMNNPSIRIKGREYQLALNQGIGGFGRQNWDSHIDGTTLILTYVSPDGEDGYPGSVLTTLKFKLTSDNTLDIRMQAITTNPTVINLSYGPLFNLAGHDAGEDALKMHTISLNCDRFIFTQDDDGTPINKSRNIGGTLLDLRIPRLLGDEGNDILFHQNLAHNLCVIRNCDHSLTFVFRAYHEKTGRVLEVFSNQPGVQFDTCASFPTDNNLDDITCQTLDAKAFDDLASYTSFISDNAEECWRNEEDNHSFANTTFRSNKLPIKFIPGKNGAKYTKFCAFGVHPQNYYNSAIRDFPCAIVRPGQVYHHNLVYRFAIQLENCI
ncbi:aldose 1-epimerase isoform X2 [Fopius arisanus]|uniref:Galactose mutarotase n=1 Tax=Fopius arisanus TaxID=64838 RepID=A0A9R1U7X1_9HYME|nr:PREDICTED: aldose 1-epimerase-like isoform X2 [Fopius arisanus]